MKVLFITLFSASLVCLAFTQSPAVDEVHNCEMYRKCKDCSTMEFCIKPGTTSLYRWWGPCSPLLPYCNPYSAACQKEPVPGITC